MILLYMIGIIIVLAFVLMILPVKYDIRINNGERETMLSCKVNYGKGLISANCIWNTIKYSIKVRVLGISIRINTSAIANKNADIKKKTDSNRDKGQNIGIIKNKRLMGSMMKAGGEIFRCYLLRNTNIRLRLGTWDPGYTGMLAVIPTVLSGYFGSIEYKPIFSDELFDVDFSAKGQIILIIPLVIVVKHLVNYKIRKLVLG